MRPTDPLNPATYDDKAIRCYQCGAFIEDPSKETDCWLCQSDNFRGDSP